MIKKGWKFIGLKRRYEVEWLIFLGWKQKVEYSGMWLKSWIHIGWIYQGWNSTVWKE